MNTMRKMTGRDYGFLALMLGVIALAIFATPAFAAGLLLAPAAVLTIEELVGEFTTKTAEFKSMNEKLDAGYKELKAAMEAGTAGNAETKKAVDDLLVKFKANADDLQALEQKLAARVQDDAKAEKSYGQQFVENESFKAFQAKGIGYRGSMSMEMKVVNSAAAGGLIRSWRDPNVTSLPTERQVIRDLLPVIPVTTSSVDYAIQATRTNNAATVAEAAAKPYSDFTWTSATVSVRVIAHLAKLTRQALEDAPRLAGEVDAELRYGLRYVEERQFLYGNNTGQNLHGIVPQATAFAMNAGYVPNALATLVDVLRLAILQVALALVPADAIVLNDADWAIIEMTKTTDGAYLFANPQGSVSPRMWGLPVVVTPAMLAGDFLVGAFRAGAVIYDRMGVEVLISTENADDFEKNLATMRAEERTAIAVKRPTAFVTGDFAAALALLTPP